MLNCVQYNNFCLTFNIVTEMGIINKLITEYVFFVSDHPAGFGQEGPSEVKHIVDGYISTSAVPSSPSHRIFVPTITSLATT